MIEQAALDENMPPVDDVAATADTPEAGAETPAESAPATVDSEGNDPSFIPEDEIGEKTQARFNKLTADKYAEKRRADALQEENARLQANQPTATPAATGEPKLEDYDYDDAAFQAATIKYHVHLGLAEGQQNQEQTAQENAKKATFNTFQEKVVEFQKQAPDFHEVTGNVPDLQPETLEAVMQHEKAAEIAYYLGKHLDVADQIVQMTPIQAAIKLGEISAQLTATPQTVNKSAAPAPIAPIDSGSSISKEQENMSMDEIYNMP